MHQGQRVASGFQRWSRTVLFSFFARSEVRFSTCFCCLRLAALGTEGQKAIQPVSRIRELAWLWPLLAFALLAWQKAVSGRDRVQLRRSSPSLPALRRQVTIPARLRPHPKRLMPSWRMRNPVTNEWARFGTPCESAIVLVNSNPCRAAKSCKSQGPLLLVASLSLLERHLLLLAMHLFLVASCSS